jgi:hypothetical protein
MMKPLPIFATGLGGLLLGASLQACACGVCIEDKVAVTYDHAVVTEATARRHVVVFAAIDGKADAQVLAREAKSAAARSRGVDRGSVRSASSPAALSFALDPGVQAPEAALGAIERAAGTPGLRLTLLRVVR